MKKLLLLIPLLLLCACQKEPSEVALDCIKKNTCKMSEKFVNENDWTEVDTNVYNLIYHHDILDYSFTFDFDSQEIITEVSHEDTGVFETIVYNWNEQIGYFTYDSGTIAVDKTSHQFVMDKTNCEKLDAWTGGLVWDKIHDSTILPFKGTPLDAMNFEQ